MGRRRLGARHIQITLRRRQGARVHVQHHVLPGLQRLYPLVQRGGLGP